MSLANYDGSSNIYQHLQAAFDADCELIALAESNSIKVEDLNNKIQAVVKQLESFKQLAQPSGNARAYEDLTKFMGPLIKLNETKQNELKQSEDMITSLEATFKTLDHNPSYQNSIEQMLRSEKASLAQQKTAIISLNTATIACLKTVREGIKQLTTVKVSFGNQSGHLKISPLPLMTIGYFQMIFKTFKEEQLKEIDLSQVTDRKTFELFYAFMSSPEPIAKRALPQELDLQQLHKLHTLSRFIDEKTLFDRSRREIQKKWNISTMDVETLNLFLESPLLDSQNLRKDISKRLNSDKEFFLSILKSKKLHLYLYDYEISPLQWKVITPENHAHILQTFTKGSERMHQVSQEPHDQATLDEKKLFTQNLLNCFGALELQGVDPELISKLHALFQSNIQYYTNTYTPLPSYVIKTLRYIRYQLQELKNKYLGLFEYREQLLSQAFDLMLLIKKIETYFNKQSLKAIHLLFCTILQNVIQGGLIDNDIFLLCNVLASLEQRIYLNRDLRMTQYHPLAKQAFLKFVETGREEYPDISELPSNARKDLIQLAVEAGEFRLAMECKLQLERLDLELTEDQFELTDEDINLPSRSNLDVVMAASQTKGFSLEICKRAMTCLKRLHKVQFFPSSESSDELLIYPIIINPVSQQLLASARSSTNADFSILIHVNLDSPFSLVTKYSDVRAPLGPESSKTYHALVDMLNQLYSRILKEAKHSDIPKKDIIEAFLQGATNLEEVHRCIEMKNQEQPKVPTYPLEKVEGDTLHPLQIDRTLIDLSKYPSLILEHTIIQLWELESLLKKREKKFLSLEEKIQTQGNVEKILFLTNDIILSLAKANNSKGFFKINRKQGNDIILSLATADNSKWFLEIIRKRALDLKKKSFDFKQTSDLIQSVINLHTIISIYSASTGTPKDFQHNWSWANLSSFKWDLGLQRIGLEGFVLLSLEPGCLKKFFSKNPIETLEQASKSFTLQEVENCLKIPSIQSNWKIFAFLTNLKSDLEANV